MPGLWDHQKALLSHNGRLSLMANLAELQAVRFVPEAGVFNIEPLLNPASNSYPYKKTPDSGRQVPIKRLASALPA
ncbi:hypothetical protein [Serratia sp. FGI94]|uniref:hypothetical protein n=1 Tax=Serratia sp. FGI94 TaxID=671990 RepID=UPI000F4DF84E|nr:hypothetical protein [Serratia sp. FGI94]